MDPQKRQRCVGRVKAVAARLLASSALSRLDDGTLIELDEVLDRASEELDVLLERHIEAQTDEDDPLR